MLHKNCNQLALLIPCYNCEDTIEEVLDSARKQTINFDEIICFIDGSPDKTEKKILAYQKKYSEFPLEIIVNDKNNGQAYANNVLAKSAKSQYIHFHDSDDILIPNFVETIKPKLSYNHIIVGHVLIVELNGKELIFDFNGTNPENDPYSFIPYFTHLNGVVICNNVWQEAGGWNEELKFYNDHNFFMRCVFTGAKIITINSVIAIWKRRNNSILEYLWKKQFLRHNSDLLTFCNEFEKHNEKLENYQKHQFAEFVLNKLHGAYKLTRVTNNIEEITNTLHIDYYKLGIMGIILRHLGVKRYLRLRYLKDKLHPETDIKWI
jgi:glycosyltransferase involved in cell wall biosynthesis